MNTVLGIQVFSDFLMVFVDSVTKMSKVAIDIVKTTACAIPCYSNTVICTVSSLIGGRSMLWFSQISGIAVHSVR